MSKPSISLIIAVYNKTHELRLVLEACARQSMKDFEVLIADDGSGEGMRRTIEEVQASMPFPLRHLWQEDQGWRKNRILNEAVRAAHGDWLVFIDGDCLPHHRFLEDHARHREAHVVLCGRRAEMSARWSARLTVDVIRSGRFERIGLREWWESFHGTGARVEEALRFESPRIRNILHSSSRGMLGSNFSVAREHVVAINGFDEDYDGPGLGEDSDPQFRFEMLGLHCVTLRHLAIQYHIHHPRTAIPARSVERYERNRREGRMRCLHGLIDEGSPLNGINL